MSENTKSDAVLLPSASVDVFAFSEDTKKTIEALRDDWRFARVTLNVEMAAIDQAIEKYAEYTSPDLVIVGTDDISEDFIEKLGGLSEQCVEGTEAIIIGPKNDVQLYRSLVGMGVRDYLVRPVESNDIADVISQALFDKMGVVDSRLVAVMGAKGGAGTTSVAQMLSYQIADAFSLKTMLMDAAGGWSTLGVSFGVESSSTQEEGLKQGVNGTDDDLERMFTSVGDHLTLFACGGDDLMRFSVDADQFEKTVDRIMAVYPVVVVDLSGAPTEVVRRMTDRAHQVVVVTTPGLISLRVARTVLKDVKAQQGEKSDTVDLVVNMRGMAGNKEISDADIETALEHKPACYIPYVPAILSEAESAGMPVAKVKGGDEVSKTIAELAQKASAVKGAAQIKKEESGSLMDKIFGGLKSKD